MQDNFNVTSIKRIGDENEEQYIWRLGNLKDDGAIDLTWEEISSLVNNEFRESEYEFRESSSYRKRYTISKSFFESVFSKQIGGDSYIEQMREERQELYKVKTQVRDERNELNRKLREQARMDTLLDTVKDVMSKECKPFAYSPSPIITGEKDMIVQLTDLHTGLTVNNFLNKFNEDILNLRVSKYLDEIFAIQKQQNCQRCYVVLGGDLISGLIHTSLRIENSLNTIQQVKAVSVLVGNFINQLKNIFSEVHVHSVAGNHSRLSPKKDDQLSGEELDALVPFYVEIMFANNANVTVHENEMGNGIASLSPRGHLWYAVHGDKDTVDSVAGRLTLLTGKKPRGILMDHRHENAVVTKHGIKICQGGCVNGTDSYALDHRLSGTPEQLVIVTSDRKPIECVYDVQLD